MAYISIYLRHHTSSIWGVRGCDLPFFIIIKEPNATTNQYSDCDPTLKPLPPQIYTCNLFLHNNIIMHKKSLNIVISVYKYVHVCDNNLLVSLA